VLKVRTVLGDLSADQSGVTDAHDHLFFRSALLPGQELDDSEAATREVQAFAELGGRAIVQWTPYGLGRRAGDLAKISADTGVICSPRSSTPGTPTACCSAVTRPRRAPGRRPAKDPASPIS
jgi:hypothetical protein